MVTFQRERLLDVWEDAQTLLVSHYEELTFGKERIKLAPDTGKYEALERDGGLWIFTAREGGKLVGYAAFFMLDGHLHYRFNSFAINDVFYIDPARRNDVWLGYRFLRFIDRELTEHGMDAIKFHAKTHLDYGPLLKRLGYEAEEVIWSKIRKD